MATALKRRNRQSERTKTIGIFEAERLIVRRKFKKVNNHIQKYERSYLIIANFIQYISDRKRLFSKHL